LLWVDRVYSNTAETSISHKTIELKCYLTIVAYALCSWQQQSKYDGWTSQKLVSKYSFISKLHL